MKLNFQKLSNVAKNCPRVTKLNFQKSSDVSKNCPRAMNQVFKSRLMLQKTVHGQRN